MAVKAQKKDDPGIARQLAANFCASHVSAMGDWELEQFIQAAETMLQLGTRERSRRKNLELSPPAGRA